MTAGARALLDAWRRSRECKVELFAPGAGAKLDALAGLDGPGGATSSLEAVRAIEMAIREVERGGRGAELVVTSPAVGTRLAGTRDVARTVIQSARQELLVVGFEVSDRGLSELLRQRGLDGVAVTVVSDRTRTGARELAGTWPAGAAPLTALEGVEPEVMKWIVHGKVLVADRRMALVGSANFTEGGLLRNVEIGVRLEGRVAEEICRFIKKLETEGWLTVAKP